MPEDSTIYRKSSTLSCDEVKLGYHKNREFTHPISDSSTKKNIKIQPSSVAVCLISHYNVKMFMIPYTVINNLHYIPK